MNIQELYLTDHEHHEFQILKGSMPIKIIMKEGTMVLLVKSPNYEQAPGDYRGMRISRFRSFNTVPNNAFYIDSIVNQDGVLYHYFEMDVM